MKIVNEYKKFIEYLRWIFKTTRGYAKNIITIILLDAFTALTGVAMAIISKNLIDNAVNKALGTALIFAAVFGIIVLAQLGIGAISSVISVKTYELMSNNIRKNMFSRITMAEWLHITKYHSGDVLTRLTSDINNVTTCMVNTLSCVIYLCVQLTAAFATLLYYEPMLAVLAFILGPFTVILSRIWGRKLKHLNKKVQESESAYRSFIQESLENMLIVKAFQMEEQSVGKISQLHSTRLNWVMKRSVTGIVASTTLGIGYWVGYFLAFCWGALKLSRGTTSFGTLTAFLQLVAQVQTPFMGLARSIPQILSAIASAERLMELEQLPLEYSSEQLPTGTTTAINLQGVTFSYCEKKPVLEEISISIKPGEIVGLIGPSGEGKTTLIRILLALIKPDNGKIELIAEDGNEFLVSAQTRDWISYVPQGNTLFSGTIEENIRSGLDASDQEVESAARAACAIDFIKDLSDGFKTKIGERGIGLSEGQAQRIAIARALLRKAPILILDEATSSLDMDSEICVLKSIQEMSPSRTCIVITHRRTALSICSRILKLKEGQILEQSIEEVDEHYEEYGVSA